MPTTPIQPGRVGREAPAPVPDHLRASLRAWAEDTEIAEVCEANGLTREDFARRRHSVTSLELFLTPVRSLRPFEWFPCLRQLKVIQQDIASMQGIEGLRNLESLWLSDNKIAHIEALSESTRLRELYLNSNRITRIEGLETLTSLETLWLCDNRISELSGLEALTDLRILNLAANRLSCIGGRLDSHAKLEELNLAANYIGSFRDISRLAALPALTRLSLQDPIWGGNPVCNLCNYHTYTLYQLGHLKMVDHCPVTDQARGGAEATFVKKQMYYSMRIKTLRRNASNLVKAAAAVKQGKSSELNLSYNVLIRLARELEREVGEAKHLPPPPEEPGCPSPSGMVSTFESKLALVQQASRSRQLKLGEIESDYNEMRRAIEGAAQHAAARLMLELQTGGNIRMEEGKPTDVWFQSCVDLVRSRFFAADFEPLGVKDLRVVTVTRVHNRHLRNRFEERLGQVVDTTSPGYKRHLEYLFVGEDPDATGELASAVEEGFRHPHEYERLRRDAGVPLTNSVFLAEQARLLEARRRGLMKTAQIGSSAGSQRGRCPWTGYLLICKAYLGRSMPEKEPAARLRSATPEAAGPCFERLVSRAAAPPMAKIRRKDYPVDAGCSYRVRCGETKQRVWFGFDPALVLPEYLVEIQYVPSPIAVSPPRAISSIAAIPAQGEGVLGELGKGQLRSHMPQGWEWEGAGHRCFAHHFLSFVYLCTKTKSEGVDTDVSSEVLSCVPVPRQRRKITEATEAVIKEVCRAQSMADISYLNLFGNHIRSMPEVGGCRRLRVLILAFNEIETIRGVSGLPHLHTLDLSFNVIKRVEGIKELPSLSKLDLNNNLIYRIDDIAALRRGVPALTQLQLQCNAVCELKSYRAAILRRLPQLRELDGMPVTPVDCQSAQCPSGGISAQLILTHARSKPCAAPLLSLSTLTSDTSDLSSDTSGEIVLKPQEHRAGDATEGLLQVTEASLERMGVRRMQGLEHCVNLRRLNLTDNEITRIEGLESCVLLEELYLESNAISRIENIHHMRCLRRLDLGQNKLSRIEGIDRLPQLTHLSVEDNEIVSLAGVDSCPALMELYAGNNRVDSVREISLLRAAPKLIILDLSGNPMCSAGDYRLFAVYSLRKLKVLDGAAVDPVETARAKDSFTGRLSQEVLEERAGADPSEWASLTRLTLSACSLRELGLLGDKFPALQQLRADSNSLVDLSGVCGLRNLVSLSLDSNKLGGAELSSIGKAVSQLHRLEVLSLESNQLVSLAGMSLRLPSLRVLHLKGNDIVRLDGLDKLPQLRELDVSGNKLKTLDDRWLVHCSELRELWLHDNGLRTLDGFKSLSRLHRLGISQNRIVDVHEIARLANMEGLRELQAMGNPVTRKPMYRPTLVFRLPNCTTIDGQTVTQDERDRALVLFHHSPNSPALGSGLRPASAPS
eukprot:Hpha_TRINITY_DN16421_c2_g8::TRINITY_DN16421_c2_g8_i1::g.159007::m.159007